jgi:hypothetical protein
MRKRHDSDIRSYRNQFPFASLVCNDTKRLAGKTLSTIKRKPRGKHSAEASKKRSVSLRAFWSSIDGQACLERRRVKMIGQKRPEYAKKMRAFRQTPAGKDAIRRSVAHAIGHKDSKETIAKRVASVQKAKDEGRYWNALQRGLKQRPNKFEQKIVDLLPAEFQYTGDFNPNGMFRFSNNRMKNADFTLFPNRTAVIECFGTYWHSQHFEDLPPDEHAADVIDNYAAIGVTCLIIWEHELKDMSAVKTKVATFLTYVLHAIKENSNV